MRKIERISSLRWCSDAPDDGPSLEFIQTVAVLVVENESREVQRLTAPAFGDGTFPKRGLLVDAFSSTLRSTSPWQH